VAPLLVQRRPSFPAAIACAEPRENGQPNLWSTRRGRLIVFYDSVSSVNMCVSSLVSSIGPRLHFVRLSACVYLESLDCTIW
jgi:hypothetical protein